MKNSRVAEIDADNLRPFIEQEVLFASEAADYLGITSQRLNQLVHTGKIRPVRKSSSGNLYVRTDLENRHHRINGKQMKCITQLFENNEREHVYEAINYFTIQTIYNGSDKKTLPVFYNLNKNWNMGQDLSEKSHEIAKELLIETETFKKAHSQVMDGFQQLGAKDYIVKKGEQHYPSRLAVISDAPMFLFMRGTPGLLERPLVSIVGSRKPSDDGQGDAYQMSAQMSKNDFVVLSGLSGGIDEAVQQAAFDHGEPAVAVLATPISHYYGWGNQEIQKHLETDGLIISQFPPSVKVERWHFAMRSALMSALSMATVIGEAYKKSDALKQADAAVEHERPLLLSQEALNNRETLWTNRYMEYSRVFAYRRYKDVIRRVAMIEQEEGQAQL
ncbi:DNA processing protein [Geomicrobium halophilum]|uniref:DNA processing protein n=1 Tax=Geomicrobium halophilum TaxID=549000 RepID=A0A841PZK6_9BACL|nr:DNA-processing protein DprA [Geomicrobium halophilum]MBB6450423.1 DNA processing protein [Geomicrobium halophilum]